jgi:MYXO-CTERM domain-containing protein
MISTRSVRASARVSSRIAFAGLAALGVLGASSVARAQSETTCTQDSDCTHGFTCQTVGATACPAIACAEGSGCTQPICDPAVIKDCEPGPCTTDSDCPTGMVCHTDSAQSCLVESTPACAPDEDCGVPAATGDAGGCTTITSSSCVPPYDLPCQVASDCGPGFTCVPDTATECSGGGAAGSAPGNTEGSSPASPPSTGTTPVLDASNPVCTTTTLSTSSCQVVAMPCTTDTDCPSTWTCTSSGSVSNDVSCAEPTIIGADGAVPTYACDAGVTTTPSQCVPPYYAASGGSFNASPTGATAGGSASVPATAAGANDDASATPSATGGTAPSGSSGGCQVGMGGAGGSGGFSLFALFGLIGLARRRSY